MCRPCTHIIVQHIYLGGYDKDRRRSQNFAASIEVGPKGNLKLYFRLKTKMEDGEITPPHLGFCFILNNVT